VQLERRGEGRFWGTVAFALVMIAALGLLRIEPRGLSASAPADEFSAARAKSVLERVLAGGQPHPTGSAENDAVRRRVVNVFGELGIETSEHETVACGESGNCARVTNVVAEIRGRATGPAVLLNAHYDSVGAGPGASDDGAGLATLLEVARALKQGAPPERTIRFLVDDGEELGLLGAEAWVAASPREDTLAVVVLEARGTSGPALLFETHRGNADLLRAYARAASRPASSSVYFSVYERLPNRTNFTVFKREGYRGMAVAFIENPARYHTPLDSLANLSDRSLQHMGDLTLALARDLSINGLRDSAENASWFDLIGTTLVHWPEAWNVWLSVAGLLLISIVGLSAWKRGGASPTEVIAGWFVILFVLVVSGGIGWGIWHVAQMRGGDAAWLANGWLLVLASWMVAVALVTVPFTIVRRPPFVLSMWTSVWLVQGIVAIVLSRLLPGAAYLSFIPAVTAGLAGVVTMLGRRRDRIEGMLLVPFGVSLLIVVPLLHSLYDSLGLVSLPGIALLAAMTLLPLLVVSCEARRTAMLTVGTVVLAVLAIVAFLLTPVHSAKVPRGLNVVSLHDGDATASLLLLGASDPIPPRIRDAAEWSRDPAELLRRPGAAEAPRVWTASIQDAGVEPPDLSESSLEVVGGQSTLRLVVRPGDPASLLRIRLPEGARLHELAYGGHTVALAGKEWSTLTLKGVPVEGVVVTAVVPTTSEVVVLEERPGLRPAARKFADLRGSTEVPIGPGDRTIVVARLAVDSLEGRSSGEALTPNSDSS
jgi:hypothetical protein